MNRIDVSHLDFCKVEPRGRGVYEKFWIQHEGTYKLVKISEGTIDQDVMEYLSSIILNSIGIPCVKVSLGYDSFSSKNCCLVDSFLEKEGDVSYEMVGWTLKRGKTAKEEIELCLNQVFQKYASLFQISKSDFLAIQESYIRILFGKCITGNFDAKLENIGIIYNEKENSYRLPPSFDNGFSFKDFGPFSYPICFIGNQFFDVFQVIDYILDNFYENVKDIISAFEVLMDHQIEDILNQLQTEIPITKRKYILQYLYQVQQEIQTQLKKIKQSK